MRASVVLLAACTAASPELGSDAALQIPGAQFRPGPFPAQTAGPSVLAASTSHTTIEIGSTREQLKSTLAAEATAAIVGVDGLAGTWILRADVPDLDAPGSPTAKATFAIGDAMPAGPFTLLVAAVDSAGRIGAPIAMPLVAEPEPPPDGDLVIALVWDTAPDLDLHVVDPLGHEAWAREPNTWKPPLPPDVPDPNEWLSGGILDRDANMDCHRDGAPSEHVIWKTRTGSNGPVAPLILSGEYVVRVDARSMCTAPGAGWAVIVYSQGTVVSSVRGWSTPPDTAYSHGAGAGVTALRFTLP